MEITLEKIELVKDRTGVTYAEAKQALEDNDGSVVDAIIDIEETVNAGKKERSFGDKGQALFKKLKDLVKKGNVAKIQVKKEDEIILNLPLNAGILGIAIAPLASVVAVVASFGFKCTIEVVKTDGTIVDVSDAVNDTIGNVAEKGSAAADVVKDKASGLVEKGKDVTDDATDKIKEKDFYDKAKDKASDLADDLKEKVQGLKKKADEAADDVKEVLEEVKDAADEAADEIVGDAKEAVEEVKDEE